MQLSELQFLEGVLGIGLEMSIMAFFRGAGSVSGLNEWRGAFWVSLDLQV